MWELVGVGVSCGSTGADGDTIFDGPGVYALVQRGRPNTTGGFPPFRQSLAESYSRAGRSTIL